MRKCNWYFIVRPKEGNTREHAEEDWLGLSSESASNLIKKKKHALWCPDNLAWQSKTKSCPCLGRDTHHSVRTMWQHYNGTSRNHALGCSLRICLNITDKDAELAARPKCSVPGSVWGSEKDHPDRGDLQTTQGPQYHHAGGGTCACTLLCLLWTGQTLTEWHHSQWRKQPFSQRYCTVPTSPHKSLDCHIDCSHTQNDVEV